MGKLAGKYRRGNREMVALRKGPLAQLRRVVKSPIMRFGALFRIRVFVVSLGRYFVFKWYFAFCGIVSAFSRILGLFCVLKYP